jgi:hypothetical protein
MRKQCHIDRDVSRSPRVCVGPERGSSNTLTAGELKELSRDHEHRVPPDYGAVLHVPNGVNGRFGQGLLVLTCWSINVLDVPAVVDNVKSVRR